LASRAHAKARAPALGRHEPFFLSDLREAPKNTSLGSVAGIAIGLRSAHDRTAAGSVARR
jgi:hypothetical protein